MRLVNLAGVRYGRLFVLSRAANNKHGRPAWRCRCDCGREAIICGNSLRFGLTRSCGCIRERRKPTVDLTGKKFAALLVIGRSGPDLGRLTLWQCLCDCGRESIIRGRSLTSGKTWGCLCLRRARAAVLKLKHGCASGARMPEYGAWSGMKQKHAGEICDRWLNSFENFLSDLGQRPIGMQLHRHDDRIPYCAENCSWRAVSGHRNVRNSTSRHQILTHERCQNVLSHA